MFNFRIINNIICRIINVELQLKFALILSKVILYLVEIIFMNNYFK